MKYKEWIMIAEKGTRGDMVWDILNDWRKERDDLLEVCKNVLNIYPNSPWIHEMVDEAIAKAEEKP